MVNGKTLIGWGWATVATFLAMPQAEAQERPVGSPIGSWRVLGEADPMTDKKVCTAYYGSGRNIQLTKTSLAISYRARGMLKAQTIRFDDEPALPTALPSRIEERIGAVIIDAGDPRWERLKAAQRMRVQVLTALTTVVNDDISLVRFSEVLARLNGPSCN